MVAARGSWIHFDVSASCGVDALAAACAAIGGDGDDANAALAAAYPGTQFSVRARKRDRGTLTRAAISGAPDRETVAAARARLRARGVPPLVRAAVDDALARVARAAEACGAGDVDVGDGGAWLVALSALSTSLGPARMTASVVGAASPASALFTELVLGVPVLETGAAVDDAYAWCGAAWLRGAAHGFGPRGVVTTTGHASADTARGASCRISYGPPPVVTARRSQVHDDVCVLVSVPSSLSSVDADALARLRARPFGAHGWLVTPAAADAVVDVLVRAGAPTVTTAWVDVHQPHVEEMTVAVGRGRHKRAVRVRITWEDGIAMGVEPVAQDVEDAARAWRVAAGVVRADVVAAWQRVSGHGRAPRGRRA